MKHDAFIVVVLERELFSGTKLPISCRITAPSVWPSLSVMIFWDSWELVNNMITVVKSCIRSF